MKNKYRTILVLLLLAMTVFPFGMFLLAGRAAVIEAPDIEAIDIGPELRSKKVPMDLERPINFDTGLPGGSSGLKTAAWRDPYYIVGDRELWLVRDVGTIYGVWWTEYELRAISDFSEVWVQTDLRYLGIEDDPRNGDPYYDPVVTQEDIDYLLAEFDSNIYPKVTQYFGVPEYHDGNNAALGPYYYNGSSRNIIMVSNIRDEWYYDLGQPYFIAGFYWGLFEYYFDRNIISIDCHDWAGRVGPSDDHKTNQYEKLIAHEEQHLIHDDYNPDDESFMNEGCSMFAEFVCNYPLSYDDINSFLTTPDNSLTIWGDQTGYNILADYGGAQLWATYLNDHYSGFDPVTGEWREFLSYFVGAGIPGIPGIENALAYFGYDVTFDEVFRNWRIANLIHTGDGLYNYKTIDLDHPDAVQAFVNEIHEPCIDWMRGTDFGTTVTILGIDTGIDVISPYGTDYIYFDSLHWLNLLVFDGDDGAYNGWRMTADGWYSQMANLMNILIWGAAYVDPADPTLTITTYWDIEDYWDFGFIQVLPEGGDPLDPTQWTSLENEYTTYDHAVDADPDIVEALPGLTSWSPWFDMEPPYNGWITMDFDLTPYAGQTVDVGFRYMTDLYTTYEGWFINETIVSGSPLEITNAYPEDPEADFMVTIIERMTKRNGKVKYKIRDLRLRDAYELGHKIFTINRWEDFFILVSPIQDEGVTDYSFTLNPFRSKYKSFR